jgi:nuclear transport factor 2 (NTF2) superfamily protein
MQREKTRNKRRHIREKRTKYNRQKSLRKMKTNWALKGNPLTRPYAKSFQTLDL